MSEPDILLALRRSFVKLGLWRERDTTAPYEITIENSVRKLGLVPEALPPDQVKVARLSKWGVAHELGINVGDVILTINGTQARDMKPKEFIKALKAVPLTI